MTIQDAIFDLEHEVKDMPVAKQLWRRVDLLRWGRWSKITNRRAANRIEALEKVVELAQQFRRRNYLLAEALDALGK